MNMNFIIFLTLTIINHKLCNGEVVDDVPYGYKSSHPEDSVVAHELEEDLEVHEVETEDGYFLHLHRLRGPKGSTPVYVQHGLLLNSITWLIPGRHKALPYILLDKGYDVWLGNFRGNTFSKKHKTLSTKDSKFWDFSWEEQGYYDIPAIANYITNATSKERMHFVGHSMASTAFSVTAVKRPEVAKKFKTMIALAPATYAYHLKSIPLRLVFLRKREIHLLAKYFGLNSFLPHLSIFDLMAKTVCHIGPLCSYVIFLLDGWDPKQFNNTLSPDIFYNFPAGTSAKLAEHFGQQIQVNQFRQFDYGTKRNLGIYGTAEPPNYDLKKFDVPVAVFWGENDKLSAYEDSLHFYAQLPKKLGMYKVNYTNFNHFDQLWAIQGPELVYSHVAKIIGENDN